MIRKIKAVIGRVIYSAGDTPLPGNVMAILFLVMFFNGMVSTMCFSYLPKMVKSFGISEVEVGHYAGFIVSAIYIGWILFSLLWGYLGDVKGNKLGVILTTSGMTVTTLVFGFSTSFYWALITRLFQGCFMGFVGVCKAMLANFLDDTNISLGFAILFTCWTIAFVIGPSAAGYLVYPAEKYPEVFSKDSLFGRFGVLLPNLIVVVCNTITIILAIIFLPNDKREKTGEDEHLIKQSDDNTADTYSECRSENPLHNQSDECCVGYSGDIKDQKKKQNGVLAKLACVIPGGALDIIKLFKSKDFVIIMLLFFILGFSLMGVEQMFPIFAATASEYNGLNFSTTQIGNVLLGSSLLLLVIQLTLISKITKYFGSRKVFIGCCLIAVFTVPLIPATSAIKNKTALYVSITSVMLINQVLINGTTVTSNVLLNNAVSRSLSGSANGLSLAMTSLGRLFAPNMFGSLYSWSLKNIKGNSAYEDNELGFPFNQYFIFYVGALTYLLCAILGASLSPSLDYKPENKSDISTKGKASRYGVCETRQKLKNDAESA